MHQDVEEELALSGEGGMGDMPAVIRESSLGGSSEKSQQKERRPSNEAQASAAQQHKYEGSTVLGERFLKDYLQVFELDEAELVGKRILDVGSGRLMRFAREAATKGINVVSLNPELKNAALREEPANHDIYGGKLRFWNKWRNKLPPRVAGLAQYLPFKDKSFDAITAFLSVPQYLPSDQGEVTKALGEMMRVVEPNGSINLVYWPDDDNKENFIQQELAQIAEKGNTVFQTKRWVENKEATVVKIVKTTREDTLQNSIVSPTEDVAKLDAARNELSQQIQEHRKKEQERKASILERVVPAMQTIVDTYPEISRDEAVMHVDPAYSHLESAKFQTGSFAFWGGLSDTATFDDPELSGTSPDVGLIQNIRLPKELRGKGVGSAIVDQWEQSLGEQGVINFAVTNIKDTQAKDFWTKRGYKVPQKYAWGNTMPYCMVKTRKFET